MFAALTPPPLLRWQLLLLFAAIGSIWPLYGNVCLIAAFILLLVAGPKTFLPSLKPKYDWSKPLAFFCSCLLLPFLAFALGFFSAQNSMPGEYHAPDIILSKTPVSVVATVDEVEALPNRRLRIILSDVEVYLPATYNTGAPSPQQQNSKDFSPNSPSRTSESVGKSTPDELAKNEVVLTPFKPALKLPVKVMWTLQSKEQSTEKNLDNSASAYSVQDLGQGLGQNLGQDLGQDSIQDSTQNSIQNSGKAAQTIAPQLLPGERIQTSLRLSALRSFANFHSSNPDEAWLEKNVQLRAFSKGAQPPIIRLAPAPFYHKARAYVEKRLISALTATDGTISRGSAVILAILMGNRYFLTDADMNLFAVASLSHSLALSGLHLGFMAALGAALAFALSRLFPNILLTLPRPKLIALCAMPLILIYLWLGGITPSLARSALMFACWAALLFMRKKHVLLDGLFWALLIMFLFNPMALHDLRLQLSASAVLAIALVTPFAVKITKFLCGNFSLLVPHGKKSAQPQSVLANVGQKTLKAALALLIISLGIQIVILPLQVYVFGRATPFFAFNLIWLPVLSLFVFPLSVTALVLALIPPLSFMASALFTLAAYPVNLLFSTLSFMEEKNILTAPAVTRPHPVSTLAFWSGLACLVIIMARLILHRHDAHSQPLHGKANEGGGANGALRRYFINFPDNLKTFLKQHFLISPTLKRAQVSIIATLALAWLLVGYSLYNRWSMEHPESARLRVLDVGQGQALLFEGVNGERLLLDGGGSFNLDMGKHVLAPELTFNRPPHVEFVVNTHPDNDHLNGLFYILENFKVDYAYFGPAMPTGNAAKRLDLVLKRQNIPPLHLTQGDYLPFDEKHYFEVLYPPTVLSKKKPTHNDYSLVMRFMKKGESRAPENIPLALACGDLSKYGIKLLTKGEEDKSMVSQKLMAKVLILPHHGSKNNYTPEFYAAVAPKLAIASASYNNPWGFPSQAVVEELKKQNIPLITTAIYGQIVVSWSAYNSPKLTFARPQNNSGVPAPLPPELVPPALVME